MRYRQVSLVKSCWVKMNIKWLSVLLGVLLILAIPSGFWPYGYYILLRWVISFSAIYLGYKFYESKTISWALILWSIAFLFNPFLPVYLDKGIWVTIDLISAIIFFISTTAIKKNEKGI